MNKSLLPPHCPSSPALYQFVPFINLEAFPLELEDGALMRVEATVGRREKLGIRSGLSPHQILWTGLSCSKKGLEAKTNRTLQEGFVRGWAQVNTLCSGPN